MCKSNFFRMIRVNHLQSSADICRIASAKSESISGGANFFELIIPSSVPSGSHIIMRNMHYAVNSLPVLLIDI